MNAAKKATAWNLFVAMITVVTINSIPVSAQEATASGMYEERLAKAVELLEKREFSAAAKAYRKANELAGGASAEALLGFATACYQTQRYSKSLDTARRVLELSNEQSIRMAAYHLLGLSLFESADGDRIRLEEAEQAFRKVIELSDGEAVPALYSLALVLQELDRQAEALATSRVLLALDSAGPFYVRTRILLCDIRSSLQGQETAIEANRDALHQDPTQEVCVDPSETPLTIAGDVVASVEIYFPVAQYTREDRIKRIQGVVILQAIIDTDGCVTNVKVLLPLSEDLTASAVEASKRAVFEPATLNGKPVAVYYNLSTNFRLVDPRNRRR
ncbi:MAG: TonB family protein [bacterium]|nr:TonB family protein [bacterium]